MPFIALKGKGVATDLKKYLLRIWYSVSFIRVDFPLPETPVIQVNVPSGISNVTFLRLLPDAFSRTMLLPFPFLLDFGNDISCSPERNFAVIDPDRMNCSTVPS